MIYNAYCDTDAVKIPAYLIKATDFIFCRKLTKGFRPTCLLLSKTKLILVSSSPNEINDAFYESDALDKREFRN